MEDLEIALRLVGDEQFGRRLKSAVESKFFWIYSLSLWNPDALWKCLATAFGYSLGGAVALSLPGSYITGTAAAFYVVFCFFAGLIGAWVAFLGSWVRPANLRVTLRLMFGLVRKNRAIADASVEELSVLFPRKKQGEASLTFERFREISSALRLVEVLSLFSIIGITTLWLVAMRNPAVFGTAAPGSLNAFFLLYALMLGMFVPPSLARYARRRLVRHVRPGDRSKVEAMLLDDRLPLGRAYDRAAQWVRGRRKHDD
jgi:hypothetical protein